jgi:hypothetical protein
MSFAPNAASMAMTTMPTGSPFDIFVTSLNSNPYFIGLMMLLLNFGGRFVSMEMSAGQEKFFQNQWIRRALIFSIMFVGTRNVTVAFIMTSIIILCVGYLFNENSSLCIFKAGVPGSKCSNTESFELTPEEQMQLQQLQQKAAMSGSMPGQLPSMPGQPPSMPGQPPSMPGQLPSMPGQPPSMPGQPPSMPGQPPSMPGQLPSMPGQLPSMPGQPPSMPGQLPSMPGQLPSMPGQPPSMPGQPPSMPGQPPMIFDKPQMIPDKPPMMPGQPPSIMENQNTGIVQPFTNYGSSLLESQPINMSDFSN